jgi:hypothetical protein
VTNNFPPSSARRTHLNDKILEEPMSLTPEAYADKKWGFIPELRKIFENLRLDDSHYGYSSASYNKFERTSDILKIAILILDNKDKLSGLVQKYRDVEECLLKGCQDEHVAREDLNKAGESISRAQADLFKLGEALEAHSKMFLDLSYDVRKIL